MALNFKITAPASDGTRHEDGPTRTLLLVDDDHTLLVALRIFFQRNGWHILEAESIGEAMKLWDANHSHIDAVLTDYSFDGARTGLDLVTYIQGRRRGFPCVVISGLWTPAKRPRDEPQVNLYYRVKPSEPRELLATIVKAIEIEAATRQS